MQKNVDISCKLFSLLITYNPGKNEYITSPIFYINVIVI